MSSWNRFPSENDRLFFRQLETIFLEYPPSVTAAVTSPLTGMQRNSTYEKTPSVAQIVAELNREKRIFDEKAADQQLKRLGREEPVDRSNRLTLRELAERHRGAPWAERILARSQTAAPLLPEERLRSFNELRAHLKLPPLTQAEFDAMPDAKKSGGWQQPHFPPPEAKKAG